MSIQADTQELYSINAEIKRLKEHLAYLKKQKEECEERILIYLEKTKQPGVCLNGQVVLVHDKQKRRHQRKEEKKNKGVHILRKYGIDNSEKIIEELIGSMRGSPELIKTLKITENK